MAALAAVWDLIARDGASPAFNKVAASADRASVATAKAESGVAGFGKKMIGVLGALAAIDVGAHMIGEAAKFQKAMLLIQTQAGASSAEVKSMSKSVLELAGPLGTSPEKLATSLYHAYSVTKNQTQALNIMTVAAKGAKVGNADLEEVTNSLTSTVASGIPGVKNLGQAMGALNAIVGAGDMKFSDLNEALGTGLLSKMKVMGLSLTDVGGALATFGDLNIRGADAATLLRMSVEAMAKQGAPGQKALSDIGIATNQLRDDMQKGGLNKAVLDLNAHMKVAGKTGKEMGGFLLDAFSKKGAGGITQLLANLPRLEQKLKAVKDGATGFGLAWKATQGTASFVFSSLVAQVESAGIAIGTKLLPAVTAAGQWLGTNIPKAVSTLSAILKPLVQDVAGALVTAWHALQAVLGVVGPALASIAGFLKDNAGAVKIVAEGVLVMWAAFKGYAIATTAIRAVSGGLDALRLKAMYAADGIRAGITPAGAAIGGIAVVLGAGLYAWQRSQAAAAAWAAQVKGDTSDIAATLTKVTGAINDTTRALVEQKLQAAGVYDQSGKLGLSYKTLTDAALGNKAALDLVNAAVKDQSALQGGQINKTAVAAAKIRELAGATGAAQHGVKQLTEAQKESAAAAAGQGKAQDNVAKSLQYSIDAHGRLVTSMVKSGSALDNTSAAMARQTQASGILKNALDVLNGVNETQEQTQDALSISLGNLANKSSLFKDANNHLSTSLKQSTVAGATNRQMLVGIIDNAKAAAQAVADHAAQQGMALPEALRKGNDALKTMEGQLVAAATQAGFSKSQVEALIGSMGILANIHVKPTIYVNIDNAKTQIDQVKAWLALVHDKTVAVNIVTHGGAVGRGGQLTGPGFASGTGPGGLPEGFSTINERGPELLHKRGSHVDVIPHSAARALIRANGLRVPGFAAGTKNYKVEGVSYESLRAAKNAAIRDYKAQIHLGIKIDGKDLQNFDKAIHGTVDQARAAFATLYADVKKEGASTALLKALQSEDRALDKEIGRRNATAAKLTALKGVMQQLASTIKGGITGSFDITSAGASPVSGAVSGKGIEAQQKQALTRIRAFASGIRKLASRHLNNTYLMQLASQGPDALPQVQALLSLHSLAGLNQTEAAISRAGSSLGTGVAGHVYGAQERSLASIEALENRRAEKIAKAMAHQIAHATDRLEHRPVAVYLDGKVLYRAMGKAAKELAR